MELPMHLVLKTLLNHVERLKGFVYESSRLIEGRVPRIEIQLRARERSRGACSHCQKPAPGYDRLAERQFQFVPLWGIPTYFRYAPRRVRCREHGIVVEHLPWAMGKRPLTASFAWFLASWAKLLSWQDVSRTFKVSWEGVFRSVEMAVDWGRARMDLTGITAAGVDEIHWRKGRFLTLVYQINEGMKRLLFVAENREETSLRKFFLWLGPEHSAQIRFICSDMWQPYLNVIAERATGALNILDRYHIAAKMNKAIDEVRAKETREVRSRNRLSKSSPRRVEACALVSAEAYREPHRQAGRQTQRTPRLQPSHRARLPPEGAISLLLGVRLGGLGRQVPRAVVYSGDALAPRAHEEDRTHAARPQTAHPQLVRGSRTGLPRRRGGPQQQVESESQKILRLSNLQSDKNHALS